MTRHSIAGVALHPEELQSYANVVATPTIPVHSSDGTVTVPADDLPGFIAGCLGLADLSDRQRDDIHQFIAEHTPVKP